MAFGGQIWRDCLRKPQRFLLHFLYGLIQVAAERCRSPVESLLWQGCEAVCAGQLVHCKSMSTGQQVAFTPGTGKSRLSLRERWASGVARFAERNATMEQAVVGGHGMFASQIVRGRLRAKQRQSALLVFEHEHPGGEVDGVLPLHPRRPPPDRARGDGEGVQVVLGLKPRRREGWGWGWQEVVPGPLTIFQLLQCFVRQLLQELQLRLQVCSRRLTQPFRQSLQLRANFRCTLAG